MLADVVTAWLTMDVFGVLLAVLGLLPGSVFWVAVALAYGLGMMIPLVDGPLMAILQAHVAPQIQARVFTLIGSLLSISSPFGLAGPVADWVGLQAWYLAAGGLVGTTALAFYFTLAVVNIEQNARGVAHGQTRG